MDSLVRGPFSFLSLARSLTYELGTIKAKMNKLMTQLFKELEAILSPVLWKTYPLGQDEPGEKRADYHSIANCPSPLIPALIDYLKKEGILPMIAAFTEQRMGHVIRTLRFDPYPLLWHPRFKAHCCISCFLDLTMNLRQLADSIDSFPGLCMDCVVNGNQLFCRTSHEGYLGIYRESVE